MVKEAKSLRGISDIFGCVNGRFVSLEVKRAMEEAQETSGRIVLQRHNLKLIGESGGYASFIYPENEKFVLQDLLNL